MSEPDEIKKDLLILSPSTALAKGSSALISRGLQQLSRGEWTSFKIFHTDRTLVSVSPLGLVAATGIGQGESLIEVFALEENAEPFHIALPANAGEVEYFRWAGNSSRIDVKTSDEVSGIEHLHVIDAIKGTVEESIMGNFGLFAQPTNGKTLLTTSQYFSEDKEIRQWFLPKKSSVNYLFNSPGHYLLGYGAIAFSTDESCLAIRAEVGLDNPNVLMHWMEIWVLRLPSMKSLHSIQTTSQGTLSWTARSTKLVANGSYGRTYVVDLSSLEEIQLNFIATELQCNPCEDELCGFADGNRVYIGNITTECVIDEFKLEGPENEVSIAWSKDGRRLFAVNTSGYAAIWNQ